MILAPRWFTMITRWGKMRANFFSSWVATSLSDFLANISLPRSTRSSRFQEGIWSASQSAFMRKACSSLERVEGAWGAVSVIGRSPWIVVVPADSEHQAVAQQGLVQDPFEFLDLGAISRDERHGPDAPGEPAQVGGLLGLVDRLDLAEDVVDDGRGAEQPARQIW